MRISVGFVTFNLWGTKWLSISHRIHIYIYTHNNKYIWNNFVVVHSMMTSFYMELWPAIFFHLKIKHGMWKISSCVKSTCCGLEMTSIKTKLTGHTWKGICWLYHLKWEDPSSIWIIWSENIHSKCGHTFWWQPT